MQEMVNREDQETKERQDAMDDASPVPVPSTPVADTSTQAHVVTPPAATAAAAAAAAQNDVGGNVMHVTLPHILPIDGVQGDDYDNDDEGKATDCTQGENITRINERDDIR